MGGLPVEFSKKLESVGLNQSATEVISSAAQGKVNDQGWYSRQFHDGEHFAFVGQGLSQRALDKLREKQYTEQQIELLNRLSVIAGAFHDVAYTQVDRGVVSAVQKSVEAYLTVSEKNKLYSTLLESNNDPIFTAIKQIFSIDDEVSNLHQYSGLNEFISAVSCFSSMKGSTFENNEMLFAAAIIQATVPWGTEEHMNKLFNALTEQFENINKRQANDEDIKLLKGVIFVALDLTNERDVSSFKGDAENFHKASSDRLWKESANQNYPDDLDSPKGLYQIIMKELNFFSGLLGDLESGNGRKVFHNFEDFYSKKEMDEMHSTAKQRIKELQAIDSAMAVALGVIDAKFPDEKISEAISKLNINEVISSPQQDETLNNSIKHLESIQQEYPAAKLAVYLLKTKTVDELKSLAGSINSSESGKPPVLNSTSLKDLLEVIDCKHYPIGQKSRAG